ncbi:MAG: ABC transporter ATP-binding protein [Candidatus Woesearchaeota archaeon]
MYFFPYVWRQKKTLFLALLLATISQIFTLLDPQIFRLILDNYVMQVDTMPSDVFVRGVFLLLLAYVGVALVSRSAKTFQEYYVSKMTQTIGTQLYAQSVQHTFTLPFSIYEDKKSGELLQKLQKAKLDSQQLLDSFINIIFMSLVGIFFVIAYAFYVHWLVGVAYLITVPVVGITIYIISKKIKQAQKHIVSKLSDLAGSTTETLRNVQTVRSLGLEEQEITRLNATNDQLLALELQKTKMIRTLSFLQGTLINGVRAGVIFVLLYLISLGLISVGEFFTLMFYSFFVFTPLSGLSTVASQYQEAKASNEHVQELFSLPAQKTPKGAKKIENIESIAFEQVRFLYAGAGKTQQYTLKDINFCAQQGEIIGIVGPSGAGKSTLTKLLVGLYEPTQGVIRVNNYSNIDYHSVRKRIGIVTQETQLFAGTIKDNLAFVQPNVTDKQCYDILKQVCLYDIVMQSPQKLHSRIGEGGIKLSGGQRQRLAIARALIRQPDVLIFDEATSALDSVTEKNILKTITDIKKQYPHLIIISIAHRISTLAHAHRIYVMDKASIVEQGTHQELLAKKGLYASLWTLQT